MEDSVLSFFKLVLVTITERKVEDNKIKVAFDISFNPKDTY